MQQKLNFDIRRYLNEAFDFYKNHWEKVLVGSLCLLLMSVIPFCQLLAMGNYFKFLRRLDAGENPSYSEIFSFTNAWPYVKSYLFLFLGIIAIEFPLLLVFSLTANSEPSVYQFFFLVPYMFILVILTFYFSIRLYYYIGILAFQGEQDLAKAWKKSFALTKGNFWQILIFSFLLSLIGQLGIFACCIGIFLTIPFHQVAQYFSFKSALLSQENTGLANPKTNYF